MMKYWNNGKYSMMKYWINGNRITSVRTMEVISLRNSEKMEIVT